jgi:glycosyltransferase involved in cell wall biosynthesis
MNVLIVASRTDMSETALFKGIADSGTGVHIVYDPESPTYEAFQNPGLPVTPLTIRNRLDFRAVKVIRQLIISHDIDIVHSLTNRALSCSLFATRGMKTRHVGYRGTTGHLSRFDPAAWITYFHPRVDKIVCVSDAVRQYLLSKHVSDSRLAVIPKGHHPSWYQHDAKPDLKEFNVPPDSLVVGYTGGLRPVKGVDTLAKAALLLPDSPSIHTIILGKGPEEARLKELTKTDDRVHLCGFRDDAARIITGADIFVMPSISREGMPRGLIEAMIQGIPPIVSRVGGLPEIVEDGKSGIVIPPQDPQALADAILSLANNPDKRRELGIAARERILSHFGIETTIEKTLQLYQSLITKDAG